MQITVLGSGSAGNSIALQQNGECILIDAGFSGRELERRLDAASIEPTAVRAIVVSHEHDDHVQALRVFCKRHGGIPAFANSLTAERLQEMNKLPADVVIFHNGVTFDIGPFQVEAFSVSHDAVDPVGFIIRLGEQQVGVLTDVGHPGKMVRHKMYNCEVLVLESNHDPEMVRQSRRPAQLQHRIMGRRGHMSNQAAFDLLPELIGPRTHHVVMTHLSRDCNRPELVEDGVRKCLAQLTRDDVHLHICRQDGVGETISL